GGPGAAPRAPGAVAGPGQAHQWSRAELGSALGWADLLAPAIRHAADGIAVSPGQARVTAGADDLLAAAGAPEFERFARLYLADGAAPAPGTPLVQPGLARTLERLARAGGPAFYEREIAGEIAAACEALGSPLRAGDLAGYRARWVPPLTAAYRDGVAASVPPPSQGMALLAILGMLDAVDVASHGADSADYVHLLVEATKLA